MSTAEIKPEIGEYQPIDDYGIIGDLRTAALVGNNGSIDFMCFPRFDSPSIFCANCDALKGGKFELAPLLKDARQKKLYIPDTNVMLSRFLSEEGVAEVSDFMVVEEGESEQALVRRAKCVHGSIRFRMRCMPRFNYARSDHRVEQDQDSIVFESKGEDGTSLRIRSSVPMEIKAGDAYAEFTLHAGEKAVFVLEPADSDGRSAAMCLDDYSSDAFKRTSTYWRSWIAQSTYNGRWRETVNRSALALKLLTSREFGSMIAAPCFGFPNELGGERNWDYRFTWIRDASFTIYGFMRLGFTSEAEAFMEWLEKRIEEIKDGSSLEVMYNIDGSPALNEFHLDHLEGYMQSRPVRIGSTNHDQLQLDIFGEVLDSVYLYDKFGYPVDYDLWKNISKLVEFVCENWTKPDSGIWEVRGGNREFLFSRVMCWVAVDRAIRIAQRRSLPSPLERWLNVRDKIYHSVYEDFWNEDIGAFTQFKGSEAMDASCLMMPLVKFLSPKDRRWISTLKKVEESLVEDSLVYRYNVGEAFSDMLGGKEGTFSICSFWYIESVSRSGDLEKARYLFEKILGYGNELGLFSEQLGKKGEFLGNVPQAFTHLAIISTAYDLNRRLSNAGEKF